MNTPHAFTLVELLVVISIIVVLLALLSPALDRAVYQTELAVCGASQRGVITGFTQYASEHVRTYPHRPTRPSNSILQQVFWNNGDDRPFFRNYFSLDILNDPLLGARADLSPEATPNSTIICSSIVMYHNTAYPGHRPMNKLGDRFTWTVAGETHRFDLLVSDYDIVLGDDTYIVQSHPDAAGKGWIIDFQDEPSGPTNIWTWVYWHHPTLDRAAPDFQYGHADGSVERLEAVGIAPRDERLTVLPMYHQATYFNDFAGNYRSHVPRP